MKKILCFFAISCYLCGAPKDSNDSCQNIARFSEEQIQTILYAYEYGKRYKLGYTLAAIAWQESCAGLYRVNLKDPSAGLYHAYLPNVIKRHYKQKDTPFKRNLVAERLIRDNDFASKIAIEDLLYWQEIRKNNWKNMIKSYNKGFSWEKNKDKNDFAENYYQEVLSKFQQVKTFIAQNQHLLIQNTKSQLPNLSTPESNNAKIKNEIKLLNSQNVATQTQDIQPPLGFNDFRTEKPKDQTLDDLLGTPKTQQPQTQPKQRLQTPQKIANPKQAKQDQRRQKQQTRLTPTLSTDGGFYLLQEKRSR